ncbi:radical SAM/SPASM domain-containing protein [Paenibacillus polymyxa]|uniref:radical SAM/SPASM domain-containing protein n=1 Tax=Paenibacillus polymyxa TaxID=1406 RepID=UPI0004DFBE26|nr:radical SAM protein [Paenibacillus polymyxa]MBE3650456.1 SPASM domain-containing protein [Paenibacillus polymyxa]UNL96222.1 radical SAM/SPASM domain-containing protein [Paenibacillus polymyxa]UQQ36940.1 SPASM domain-containing protein [Paenibacillus polymyxa]
MQISFYNEYLNLEQDGREIYLIYNSLSNGFGEIQKELYNAFITNDVSYLAKCEEIDHLIRGQFVYQEPINELEQMEQRFTAIRNQEDRLSLTILPTFNCNFRCYYCYEKLTEKSGNRAFTDKIQKDILLYVQQSMEASHLKHVSVNWTGGEPLLEFKKVTAMMEKMNELAIENQVEIVHNMVSNGYLLTRKRAQVLKDLGLRKIQITLDGSQKNHDQRRVLANQQGTFDQIINNIRDSCDLIHITVRSNVDHSNVESFDEYIEYLGKQDFKHKMDIYFSPTTDYDTGGCSSSGGCFANKEFSRIILGLYSKALKNGLHISYYPKYEPVICAAISKNTMVIQPDGWIQKCWDTVGNPNHVIGHISDFTNTKGDDGKWMGFSPYTVPKCRNCSVLPLCGGGCAQQSFESADKQPICCEYKYNLKEMLEFNFQQLSM